MSESKIYALLFDHPTQKGAIDKYCFRECGKIIVGAITDEQFGAMMVCRTDADKCPCLEKEMDEPFGDVNGENVYLRKLKHITEGRDA